MRIPVDVWHANEALIDYLKAEKTKESKLLLRRLDRREFFSNALSYLFSLLLFLAIIGFVNGMPIFSIIAIVLGILSFWGSSKLKDSAVALLANYRKQKQKIDNTTKKQPKDDSSDNKGTTRLI